MKPAISRKQPITSKLDEYRQLTNQAIADYFDSKDSKFGLDLQGAEIEAFSILEEFSRRPGKRLRGSLALFAYECFAGSPNSSAIKMSVALELVQNYLIIIDDIMDHSSMRRGKPTLHRAFAAKSKLETAEANHLGSMMAINVALLAMHMASELLCQVEENPAHINLATKTMHKNILMTGYGQIDDLYSTYGEEADEVAIIRLHELKDHYTFINPLQVGAAMAGVSDPKIMEHLKRIGQPAGVAFQLQDDILGLFGDQKETGKSTADDLREGKFTLLMRYTIDHAGPEEVKKVRFGLGNPKLADNMHKEIKDIVKACGALKYVEAKAADYSRQAKQEIDGSAFFDEQSKAFLDGVMDYSIDRKT